MRTNDTNAFAIDLWSRAANGANGNFTISPASIAMALAMTYGGARGETAAQMKRVLCFGEDVEQVMASWGALARSLADPASAIKIRIANRLFGEQTSQFVPAFIEQTRAAFGAPFEQVDFKGAPDPSRVRINTWVEGQTEERIKDLLPDGSITTLTRLVLVNAIYFLGDWLRPFDAAKTKTEPFKTGATTTKPAPLMRQVGQFAFGESRGVKVLELPYVGGSVSLFVVLPDAIDGLTAVEATLSPAVFDTWIRAVSPQLVSVYLPRFTASPPAALALKDDLEAMGMPAAFDPSEADFRGIADPLDPEERLVMSNVFHKAFVKVDEKGTEAAAATAVVLAARSGAPPKPAELRADHPFLFFIVDKASGLVLFMGRVREP